MTESDVVEQISKLLASDKVLEKDDEFSVPEDNDELENLLKNVPVKDEPDLGKGK